MSTLRTRAILSSGVLLSLVFWAAGELSAAQSEAPRLRAAGRGRPWVNLRDAVPQTFLFRNAGGVTQEPALDGASPTAVTTGDFDRDGFPDVLATLATPDGGILAMYLGDPGAIASESVSPPFRGEAYIRRLPVRPDFVAAGDFDADGDIDAVVASRGLALLFLLEGDGRGGFGPAKTIVVQGGVTALAAGEINRPDGLQDVAVAVDAAASASLLVFESPRGAFSGDVPEIVPLPSPARDLALGRFHDRVSGDVAVAVRTGVVVLEGRDRKLTLPIKARSEVPPARLVAVDVAGGVQAVAAGEFSPPEADGEEQRYDRDEIAALDTGGRLLIAALEDGEAGPRTFATRVVPFELPRVDDVATAPTGTRLTRGKVSSLGGDDLLLVDGPGRRIVVLHPAGNVESTTVHDSTVAKPAPTVELDAEGVVVTAIPMRLNADGQDDLVIFQRDSPNPVVALSAPVATFTVNSLADLSDVNPGDAICFPCTLRAAIQNANASAGADAIVFNVGSGVPSIDPVVALPAIADPVTLLGDTGGATRIQIGGSLPPFADRVLRLDAGAQGSVIRALIISQSRSDCIYVLSADTRIEGCWIGLNAAGGFFAAGCSSSSLYTGGARDIVGGATAAARNVIANSPNSFLLQIRGRETVIQGNYIGTDAAGMLRASEQGVLLSASGIVVGGPAATPGEPPGNLLASHVIAQQGTGGLLVQGNLSGLKADGFTPIGMGGVTLDFGSRDATIGGPNASLRNIISGGNGIRVSAGTGSPQESGHIVQGNWIGLARDGSATAGNADGIYLWPTWAATIGGVASAPGEPPGNVISGNSGSGIQVLGSSIGNAILGNRISFNGLSGIYAPENGTLRNMFRGNSIVGNGALGIDLGPAGVTQNDAGDGDTGSNELQNFPVIEHAVFDGVATTVEGTLDSRPGATFVVEVFSNPSGMDSSGHGEGESPVGETTATTNASGFAQFALTVPGKISFPTAVATDSNGNTSEFSSALTVPGEASSRELRASRGAGSSVALTYAPACGATDHALYVGYAGPAGIAGGVSWLASYCGLGTGGTANFDPGTPGPGWMLYFVVVGQSDSREGSFGRDSAGAPRAEAVGVGNCDLPLALDTTCP